MEYGQVETPWYSYIGCETQGEDASDVTGKMAISALREKKFVYLRYCYLKRFEVLSYTSYRNKV